ncbi:MULTISPECIES: type II and III secretion system protein family protein [unclassified Massilia]|uniref:type II and III secretion system protein family protein n=1 Tax=unclassified Massilia TaxID=2609279 RepID=UPI0017863F65|nr:MULTISPECIES: type II and III secretion system protein family protein [unclassified Massilia]MBD8533247.1 type II and III secretion system protein family protein [Massilia sp. CFBP 13647]MBD8674446.1 type II and III secretion system protein family protein [Massilia sp. CFBP 13721]
MNSSAKPSGYSIHPRTGLGSLLRQCALGGVALTLAGAAHAARVNPQADAAPAAGERTGAGPRCSGEAARPAQVALQMGKSTLMRLPEVVQNRSVGNPEVVQAMLVSPDTMYIAGVDVGTTNMIVQGRSGLCSVLDITVSMDPSALQATLAAVMPEEKEIRVLAAADSLVLTGTVSDASAVARAAELATAYVRRPLRPLGAVPKDLASNGADAATAAAGPRLVNLLAVAAPQQVQLEVKVAEVSKSLLEKLETGTNWSFFGTSSWATTLATNFLSGTLKSGLASQRSNGNGYNVGAQTQDSLVRVLAEPNVMAISGQEGSFLAGGKFYIPVAQDNNRITLEEKEFGVGLRFTPTVLGGGRINLRVAPEVSELSREGIGINATGLNASAILPVVTTRRASTTVQLYDGQSFAIGGLIKNNLVTGLKGLPVLGEVPVLGALFRSTDFQQDRTELVFVITARLVKPLTATGYALPTDGVEAPSRAALMLGGRLESTAKPPAPSARTGQSVDGFELK